MEKPLALLSLPGLLHSPSACSHHWPAGVTTDPQLTWPTPAMFPDSFWKSHPAVFTGPPGDIQLRGVCDRNQEPCVTTHLETGPSSRRLGNTGRAERPCPLPASAPTKLSVSSLILVQNFPSQAAVLGSVLPPSRPGPAGQPCPLGLESKGLGRGQLCALGEATHLLLTCGSCYPCDDLPHKVAQLTGGTGQPEPAPWVRGPCNWAWKERSQALSLCRLQPEHPLSNPRGWRAALLGNALRGQCGPGWPSGGLYGDISGSGD